MKHAMIDIETLGLGIQAPLFEIGVCIFDLEQKTILSSHQINVDLLDVVLKTGFAPQQGTIDWWCDQTYDPTQNKTRLTLTRALNRLNHLLTEQEVQMVWGNSPSFDMVIIEQHYKALGRTPPWSYKQELDFRTLKWLHRDFLGREMPPVADEKVSHNAERDAQQQTEVLLHMLGSFK
jgi:hypothetical protein